MRPLPPGAYCIAEGPAEGISEALLREETLLGPSLQRRAVPLTRRCTSPYTHANLRSPSVQSLASRPASSPTSVLPGGPSASGSLIAPPIPRIRRVASGAVGHKDNTRLSLQEGLPGRLPTKEPPEEMAHHKGCETGCLSLPAPPAPSAGAPSHPGSGPPRSPANQAGGACVSSCYSSGVPWCPSCQARSPFCYAHPPPAAALQHYLRGASADLSALLVRPLASPRQSLSPSTSGPLCPRDPAATEAPYGRPTTWSLEAPSGSSQEPLSSSTRGAQMPSGQIATSPRLSQKPLTSACPSTESKWSFLPAQAMNVRRKRRSKRYDPASLSPLKRLPSLHVAWLLLCFAHLCCPPAGLNGHYVSAVAS